MICERPRQFAALGRDEKAWRSLSATAVQSLKYFKAW